MRSHRAHHFFPLIEEGLYLVDLLREDVELFSAETEILFSDFVEQEPFPELVVVVNVAIIGFAVWGVDTEVFTDKSFGVGFEFLYFF